MRALATRPRRLALACAMISAATLGTVSASAASASDASTEKTAAAAMSTVSTAPKHTQPPAGAFLAIAYKPTSDAPDDVNTASDKFAECMREQGQSVFPDFHASKDEKGRLRLDVKVIGGKDFHPASDGYKDALDACAPILEKVGITFPDAPDDQPAPPEGPGKGEPPSLHKQQEPGQPGEPDLPSLTSSIATA